MLLVFRNKYMVFIMVFSFTQLKQSSSLKSLLQSIYEAKNKVELKIKLSISMYTCSLTLEKINDINGH